VSTTFKTLLAQVESQYTLLCRARLRAVYEKPHRKHIPNEPGVYVLYENGDALYVGRTEDIRRRLGEHSLPGSDQYAANLAIAVARRETCSPADYTRETSAGYLLKNNPQFQAAFSQAKARIGRMRVRYTVEPDPDSRYLLVFYTAKELPTRYNTFGEP